MVGGIVAMHELRSGNFFWQLSNFSRARAAMGAALSLRRKAESKQPRKLTKTKTGIQKSLRNVLDAAFQTGFIGGVSGRLSFSKRDAKAKAMERVPRSDKYASKHVKAKLKAEQRQDPNWWAEQEAKTPSRV